jgi:hypothetical protein
MKTPLFAVIWLVPSLELFAHGRSEEMAQMLNAPVPEWMSLAEPINVLPVNNASIEDSFSFRPRSGGATNTRNRIQIPARGIEFEVGSVDYTGNKAAGYGVSLNPDGTKLLVNNGMTVRLYEITASGEHKEQPIQLPNVTYDEGEKGFILGWSWAGDDVLVGRTSITDYGGHETIERRLYVFHLEERALARLDLRALKLTDSDFIEIAGIGTDLKHLKLLVNEREFSVKADLEAPPVIIGQPTSRKETGSDSMNVPNVPPESGAPRGQDTTAQDSSPTSSIPWVLIIALSMVMVALLLIFQKRKRRKE